MKIAYVIYDYSEKGGIERYIRMLSSEFSKAGHEIHIFSTKFPDINENNVTFHKINLLQGLPFFVKYMLFCGYSRRELRKQQFDIIHSQGSDCLTHTVITIHNCHQTYADIGKHTAIFEYIIKLLRPIHRIYLNNEKCNLSISAHSRVIAVSEGIRQELLRYYKVPDNRLSVVCNGVDIHEFNPVNRDTWRHATRKALSIADNDIVVLFVANDPRRKGLSTVFKALRLLNDCRITLLCVGKINSVIYRLLAKIAGLKNKIVFVAQTDDIARYYACSDLFLFPTRYEAYGMVITEAMASGIPVLVSRIAGAAHLIEGEQCLIDDPLDEKEIKEKLKCLIENRENANKIGAGLRKAVEQYAWENTARETMAVYRNALDKV